MQVEQLLVDDPDNEEYKGIFEGLVEVRITTSTISIFVYKGLIRTIPSTLIQVINLSKELLSETAAAATTNAVPTATANAAITEAPELQVSSSLPPQMAHQIRVAQQRAALAGQGNPAWAIGATVQAKYSGDDGWYDATVTAVSVSGNFIVTFDSYGNQEEIAILENLRHKDTSLPTEATEYKGVQAPKRNQVIKEGAGPLTEMPKWMEIDPADDEKTKEKKRKLIKNFKSKQRFQKRETLQTQKADAWKSFQANKSGKKKAGFMTGRKKDSMFSVAEGEVKAKVGVTGSGKGMTEHGKRKKHDFNAADVPEPL